MLFDTHAHLDFPALAPDLDSILERADQAGVSRIYSISTTLESAQRTLEIARQFPSVRATAGIHPCYVDQSQSPDLLTSLRTLALEPQVVALGEIGIDYHHTPRPLEQTDAVQKWESQRELQLHCFKQQLDLALELGLNVIVHQRDSWEDTLQTLSPYAGKLRAVFHCFSGNLEQAHQLMDLGFLVSFTGIVTFKSAQNVQECAARLPKGSFFLETDCPFLAPVPHRGKRCEPAYLRLIAEYVAKLRGESLHQLADHTSETAELFFQRKSPSSPLPPPLSIIGE
jgi:TatD DNase family protein